MLKFEDICASHEDFLFNICCKIEPEGNPAEEFYSHGLHRISTSLPQFRGGPVEVWLCRCLVDVHRSLHHSLSSPEGSSTPLLRLTSEYRWPLVLREVAGLSYRQIGQSLQVPVGTVRARIARARSLYRGFREEASS